MKLLLNFHKGSYVKIPHNSKLASINYNLPTLVSLVSLPKTFATLQEYTASLRALETVSVLS